MKLKIFSKLKLPKKGSSTSSSKSSLFTSLIAKFKKDSENSNNKPPQFEWREIPSKVFAFKNWANFHQGFLWATLFIFLSGITRIVGVVINGFVPLPPPVVVIDQGIKFNPDELDIISSQNLFKTGSQQKPVTPSKEKPKAPILCYESDKESSLPIKLKTAIVLQDSIKSLVAVQVRSERLIQEFREGDKISSMAKIDKIERMKMIVKNLQTGACEYIEADDSKSVKSSPIRVLSPKKSQAYKIQAKKMKGIENDGNNFKISRKLLDTKLADLQSILTQALAIEVKNPDGTLSFKITEIVPGSIYNYLGIQDGDMISEINGSKIKTTNDIMNLFGKLRTLKKLNLSLNRQGEKTEQSYVIE